MSAFVCELCYREGSAEPIRWPSDRVTVHLAFMTHNNQQRLRQVKVMDVCREHAAKLAENENLRKLLQDTLFEVGGAYEQRVIEELRGP
jgi:hypothetical protein